MDLFQFVDFKTNLRTLWKDIFLLSLLGGLILYISNTLIKLGVPNYLSFLTSTTELILVPVFFIYLVVLFVFVKKMMEEIVKRISGNKVYKFRNSDFSSFWVFNGKTEPLAINELAVRSSRAGSLLKKYYWRDLKMSFEMKWIDDSEKSVGLIFRAEDLDNYFMIEIKESELKPHIRYRGGWEIVKPNDFARGKEIAEFKRIVLEVKNDISVLKFQGQQVLRWLLPTHVDVNHWESGTGKKDNDDGSKQVVYKGFKGHVQEIPFRDSYGMIGFRAHVYQGAIIRNLKVEPL